MLAFLRSLLTFCFNKGHCMLYQIKLMALNASASGTSAVLVIIYNVDVRVVQIIS